MFTKITLEENCDKVGSHFVIVQILPLMIHWTLMIYVCFCTQAEPQDCRRALCWPMRTWCPCLWSASEFIFGVPFCLLKYLPIFSNFAIQQTLKSGIKRIVQQKTCASICLQQVTYKRWDIVILMLLRVLYHGHEIVCRRFTLEL